MSLSQSEISCFCDYKIESHPNKPLIKHLENVKNQILDKIEKTGLNFDISKDEIKKIAKIIAIAHDFGKSTKFFQEYLYDKTKKSDKTNHSKLSAFFGFYLAEKLNLQEKLSVFIAINSHHGQLPKVIENSFDFDIGFTEEKQIKSIDFNEIQSIYNYFLKEDGIVIDFKEFILQVEEDSELIYQIIDFIDSIKNNNLNSFFLIQFLFSLLIDADKLDASGLSESDDFKNIIKNIQEFKHTSAFVDNHKNKPDNLAKAGINNIREDIYQQINKFQFNPEKKIYSINVPTGTGKTFASLNFAFKIKEKLDFNPKIIYCLPFTSIIDQNYSVIEGILKSNGELITSDKLLKHHHLAEIAYKTQKDEKPDENESLETDKSLLLTENWMSSIVVTTFAQFFHSLISNRNKSLKKFHNIANSIVILDEIQAVPYKYWKLINEVLTEFSKVFNTYFVLVTATQPLIFKDDEIVSVIDEKKKKDYYESPELNRIILDTSRLKEDMTLETFKGVLVKDIKDNPDKSFLIILNTIKSSQDVFSHLYKELDKNRVELKYLSTTILPFERSRIINEIKNPILCKECEKKPEFKEIKEKMKQYVIVSTQVVEAGVDIDLDIVYRDLAPLDCIFQSAGRCNRNGNGGENKGQVKIVNLKNENGNFFSGYVYEQILREATKTVLEKKNEYSENEFFSLANEYYKKVNECKSDDTSKKILDSMKSLDFEGIKEFQLIEDSQSQDFFIELNPKATKIKDKFKEIYDTKKGFERKNALLELKKEFYQYVISVRVKKNQKFDFSEIQYQELDGNPIIIPNDEVKKYYKSGGIGLTFDESDKDFDSGIMIV
ncbi:MAG TPA: CRISPR-associated helicase Cas3' [Candidatus Gastranaerophilales bacterium]|nr:CRISPR-associated helicase Cas3' [Candidatus Gastranaerophilales bacterium]